MNQHRAQCTTPRDRIFYELVKEIRRLYLADLVSLLRYAQELSKKRLETQSKLQRQITYHDRDND